MVESRRLHSPGHEGFKGPAEEAVAMMGRAIMAALLALPVVVLLVLMDLGLRHD